MPTVLIGGLPAARVTDLCTCVGPPDVIVKGSFTVLIGGLPAARMGDLTAHGGVIVTGMPNVIIGDAGSGSAYTGAGAPGAFEGSALVASAESFSAPRDQVATLQRAARVGAPFCDICKP
jgi:hypothetical protein